MGALLSAVVSDKKSTKTIKLEVVLWNLGKASDSLAKAKERNEAIALIADNNLHSAAMILASELPSGKVGELIAGEGSLDIKGKREAVVIPRGPMNERMQFLDARDLGRVFDSCKSKLKSRKFYYDRFEVCIFHGEILMAAYHGRHKTTNKDELLDDAVVFIEQIRQDKNCNAVIIGGDFNIGSGVAENRLQLSSVSGGVLKGIDCVRNDPIDFIMCWPISAFKQKSDPKVIPVANIKGASGREGKIFDHPIFVFDLEFEKPAKKPATNPVERPAKRPAKKTDTQPAKTTDTKPAKKTDTKPAKKTDTKPAKKTDTKLAKKTDTKPAKETYTNPAKTTDTKPAKKTDTKLAKKTDTKPAKKTDTKPAKETDTKLAKKTDTKPAKKTDTKSAKKTATKSATKQVIKPVTKSVTKPAKKGF